MPRALGRTLGLVALLPILVASGPPRSAARDLVLPSTGEAAVAQPMVVLTLGGRANGDRRRASSTSGTSGPRRKNTLRAHGDLEDLGDLDTLGADLPAVAILDTGASGHILSQGTAARFGITAESGSRYVEAGMSGDHAMTVSPAVALEVTDIEPESEEEPRRGRQPPASFRLPAQRLLLNEAPADLTALLSSPGAMVDVVGMPLIRERVIEIVPDADTLPVLAVRLHPSAAGLPVDAWIPLDLVDFNRRDPRNRGPSPSLATNPLVPGVQVKLGAADAAGDWLLDTGAACTMISTATARRLGLVDGTGEPTRRPEFTLPVGGVGGGHSTLPGFRLDRLVLTADDGRHLVFPAAAVVVHDISTVRADGAKVTLDGVLGMNLLLPSGNGMTMLGATTQLPSPFTRVVVDVARERLGLTVAR
jgi:hypothetical protein